MWFDIQMKALWHCYLDTTKWHFFCHVGYGFLDFSVLLKAGNSTGKGGEWCWPDSHPEPWHAGMASPSSHHKDPPEAKQSPATKSKVLPTPSLASRYVKKWKGIASVAKIECLFVDLLRDRGCLLVSTGLTGHVEILSLREVCSEVDELHNSSVVSLPTLFSKPHPSPYLSPFYYNFLGRPLRFDTSLNYIFLLKEWIVFSLSSRYHYKIGFKPVAQGNKSMLIRMIYHWYLHLT